MKRAKGDWFLRFVIPAVLLAAMLFAQTRGHSSTCSTGLCTPPPPATR